jgi:cytochrome c biogenesis protein CcmG, thiol:disulfide interchange protein DsbE
VNWKRAWIAAAAAAPVIALLGWGFRRDPAEIPSPLPGHQAPVFALQVFAPGESPLRRPVGDTVRLADLRGEVVVVNFWASWCLSCAAEHATLTEVARQYAGRPVRFVGVLYDDSVAPALAWIAGRGGQSYPSVLDPDARTAIDFGLYGVPETYFIDPAGRVAFKQTGPVTSAVVSQVVDSLLGEVPGAAPVPKAGT